MSFSAQCLQDGYRLLEFKVIQVYGLEPNMIENRVCGKRNNIDRSVCAGRGLPSEPNAPWFCPCIIFPNKDTGGAEPLHLMRIQ